MSERRGRKPLLEALVGRIDGYDVLAEIAGEREVGREEKKEERPADTISQLMSSLPMLMILPAVLPLLQQTLSQTLSSSTVNVKVESATSIIPISISASTAIVPIEIKASTVTLNVNIAGQSTTINVSVVGDASVVITGQYVGISILGTYENLAGRDFTVVGEYVGTVGAGAQNATIIDRYNDTGRTVLIEGFSVMCRPAFDSYVFVGKLFAELLIDGISIGAVTITGEKMSDSFVLLRSIRVARNSNIKVVASNFGTTPVYVRCVVYGYY